MRRCLLAISLVAAFGLAACGGSPDSHSGGCVTIGANGQVCGDAAVQWCQATEASRALKIDLTRRLQEDTTDLEARARRCSELTDH